ncbi:MAG: nucleotide exchange factor GrpE [Acidobacteriota bacterium]|jgi:molecular chaperone GrpE
MTDEPKGPEKIDLSEILGDEDAGGADDVEVVADGAAPAAAGGAEAPEEGSLEERHLRLRADFENYRRRMAKEVEENRLRAEERLVGDLLPVLDNLDRALGEPATAPEDPFREGVRMIRRQLLETLERAGLAPVEAEGCPFDPSVHEAVAREEREDLPAGSVAEEMLRGYTFRGRLLRPSMVKVSFGTEPEGATSAEPDSGDGEQEPADRSRRGAQEEPWDG